MRTDEEPVHTVRNLLRDPAERRSDDRHAGAERFENHQGTRLEQLRRHDHRIECRQPRPDVGMIDRRKEADPSVAAAQLTETIELAPVGI